ncbi:MarR family transcriptional regulator [Pontibacter sp. E15-1]|uniref:MarR family winged helix-turn-helix transcriptional regulator n=1 Tax=Pontibacter sp. E15-1 TaxID=2919918 RepID=UPI001F4FF9ED|nr:MarR family transcriptional regulator [Pontibacter sp. E15-1]MCJ8165989.1 MarR family transcriptional regulator [Pontibacter sp. E15-1]
MRQKFKEHDVNITFEMLQVLRFLWGKDGVNQQEIADAILKDKASLTYLLDNLVRRKLVQRTEDSQDRRNKIITLTDEGQEMKDLIMPWITEMFEIAGRNIPSELIGSGLILFEAIYLNFEQQNK